MPFEVFQKGSAPVPTVPFVTIQKRGLMSMNQRAFEMMGEPDAIEFLWDADRRIVGLRAAGLTNPNAYPTRAQAAKNGRGTYLVAATLFTQYIGIDTSEARRWVPEIVDGILCIDLTTPGQLATSPRGRKTTPTTESAATSGEVPSSTPNGPSSQLGGPV